MLPHTSPCQHLMAVEERWENNMLTVRHSVEETGDEPSMVCIFVDGVCLRTEVTSGEESGRHTHYVNDVRCYDTHREPHVSRGAIFYYDDEGIQHIRTEYEQHHYMHDVIEFFRDGEHVISEYRISGAIKFRRDGVHVRTEYKGWSDRSGVVYHFEDGKCTKMEIRPPHPYTHPSLTSRTASIIPHAPHPLTRTASSLTHPYRIPHLTPP